MWKNDVVRPERSVPLKMAPSIENPRAAACIGLIGDMAAIESWPEHFGRPARVQTPAANRRF